MKVWTEPPHCSFEWLTFLKLFLYLYIYLSIYFCVCVFLYGVTYGIILSELQLNCISQEISTRPSAAHCPWMGMWHVEECSHGSITSCSVMMIHFVGWVRKVKLASWESGVNGEQALLFGPTLFGIESSWEWLPHGANEWWCHPQERSVLLVTVLILKLSPNGHLGGRPVIADAQDLNSVVKN